MPHRLDRRSARGFAVGLAVVAAFAGFATASPVRAATPIPRHVFSPYFETWTGESITTVAQRSGARFFTIAFLETLPGSPCTLAWNGESGRTVGSGAYLSDIASLRAMGGDVIPSFGGFTADHEGREIGDSCTDVTAIAEAYEQVITTYEVSRLDMDVEVESLDRPEGIDRRNKAIKLVQDWAAATGRPLKISYTLPTGRQGLGSDGLAVLQNAVANGVRIDIVTPMVFDYYDGEALDMGASAISALRGLHRQLKSLLPGKTGAELWAIEGAILMIGRDDYPTTIETTKLQDARQLRAFAALKGMAVLSFWAIQRDNGGCPGTAGSGECSGIRQSRWAFTKILKGFTSP